MERRTQIDKNWKFSYGDIQSANMVDFIDSKWDDINLPHDSGIGLEFDGGHYFSGYLVGNHLESRNDSFLPKLVCWYRKELLLDGVHPDQKVYLEFEGVYRDHQIWVNGHFAGNHVSGYTGVVHDITPLIHTDNQPNIIAIRVDPRGTEGWWYEGSGIYRHVWLVVTEKVHVANWGTFVTTPSVDKSHAVVSISTDLQNDESNTQTARLVTSILDPQGQVIKRLESSTDISANSIANIKQECEVLDPVLWSLDNPALYKALSEVYIGDKIVDSYQTTFGIRFFEFTSDKGFFLNGEHVQFRGMCLHHDWGGVGTGLPDRLNEKTVEVMKEMGCTVLRSSHNPAAPSLMEACDRLGMLMLCETRNLYILNGAEKDLRDLIHRDRNHPCNIAWSLANTAGSPDGLMTQYLKILNNTVHEEDPSRPSLVCLEANDDANANGFALVTDIVGYNGGGMGKDDRDHQLYPERKMFISEFSSGRGTRGIYVDLPPISNELETFGDGRTLSKGGQYLTEFHNCQWHEAEWTHIAERPWLAGGVMWSGIEYRAETVGWPIVTSQFGVLDTCRLRKDAFYYYLQEWTSEPMVHIFPHWTWPGKEGCDINVWCYSNCDSVELVLNGKSLGSQNTKPLTHLQWNVPYTPGTLLAKGIKDSKVVCEHEIHTAGPAAKIVLSTDRTKINADGNDVAVLTATIQDIDGNMIPDACNQLIFGLCGEGTIIGVSAGDPGSHENEHSNTIKAFNGLCIALVQSTLQPGSISVTVKADGLADGTIELSGVVE